MPDNGALAARAPLTTDDSMPIDSRQQATLERAAELALSYLESLDASPVGATTSLSELRRRFSRPLPDEGVDPVTVIDELARDVAGGLLGNAGGRFYGWVIGAGLPAALAADWLTSTILWAAGVLLKDFKTYVQGVTDRIRDAELVEVGKALR